MRCDGQGSDMAASDPTEGEGGLGLCPQEQGPVWSK